jgi:hypothetical protein
MAVSWGAGGISISPRLSLRAIVSARSPVFALLLEAHSKPPGEFRDTIEFVSQELFQLFQQGRASPMDVLSDGTTLLHVRFVPFIRISAYIGLL